MLPMKLYLSAKDEYAAKLIIVAIAFCLVVVAFFAASPQIVSKIIMTVIAGIQLGTWIFRLSKWIVRKDYE